MHIQQPAAPVVVLFRNVEQLLSGSEAIEPLNQIIRRDSSIPDVQRAAAAAAIGRALADLQRAQLTQGADVLSTAHNGAASRLQSLIAECAANSGMLSPLATGGLEAKFDPDDWIGWAGVVWEKIKNPIAHTMVRPSSSVPESLPDRARIGILGDWATGLYGAPVIAESVKRDADGFNLMIQLGDVYYAGTKTEVQARFLDIWPQPSGATHRALNSNHEMYAGGFGYFDLTLPKFGQDGSYFAFQNKHWLLVGLDLAYTDHDIDAEQVRWVQSVIDQAGARRVIFLSHHQPYSHFESLGSALWAHPEFARILSSERVFAWYWGHEHRCTIFEAPDRRFSIYGRCIGHGGMPQTRDTLCDLPRATEPNFARADWKRSAACVREGMQLPPCVVLDGENPYIKGEEAKFSPNGYAVLVLDGPTLLEEVRDPTGQVIYSRTFRP